MNPQGFRDKRALTDLDSPPVGLLIEGEAQVEDQPSAAPRAPLSKHGAADGSGEILRWPLHKQNRTPKHQGPARSTLPGCWCGCKVEPTQGSNPGPEPTSKARSQKDLSATTSKQNM